MPVEEWEQMGQPTFADLEFQGKKRKTRGDLFLECVDGLIPWQRLEERQGRRDVGPAVQERHGHARWPHALVQRPRTNPHRPSRALSPGTLRPEKRRIRRTQVD